METHLAHRLGVTISGLASDLEWGLGRNFPAVFFSPIHAHLRLDSNLLFNHSI